MQHKTDKKKGKHNFREKIYRQTKLNNIEPYIVVLKDWIGGDFNLPDIDWRTNSIPTHRNSIDVNQLYLPLHIRKQKPHPDCWLLGSTHCLT